MSSLTERVKGNPELKRKLTRKVFSLARAGESRCIPQSEFNEDESGVLSFEHPDEGCPLDIAIRDVPEKYEPVKDASSVKVKLRRDIYEGHLAGDVIGVDCFAQKTDTQRVKRRQEATDPDRERQTDFRENLSGHL